MTVNGARLSAFEHLWQPARLEKDDRLVVIFAQLLVSGTGKRNDTKLGLRESPGSSLGDISRFAWNWRVGLQAIASAGNVSLNNVDGLSAHEIPMFARVKSTLPQQCRHGGDTLRTTSTCNKRNKGL